jgi:hypothetical protein
MANGKPGRPSKWNDELKEEVIKRITSGEPVNEIFRDPHLPSKPTFYYEMAKDAQFLTAITRARKAGAGAQFDEFVALADQADKENFNAIKVRLWARTWVLGRIDPALYGEKQLVTGADGEGPVQFQVRSILDEKPKGDSEK